MEQGGLAPSDMLSIADVVLEDCLDLATPLVVLLTVRDAALLLDDAVKKVVRLEDMLGKLPELRLALRDGLPLLDCVGACDGVGAGEQMAPGAQYSSALNSSCVVTPPHRAAVGADKRGSTNSAACSALPAEGTPGGGNAATAICEELAPVASPSWQRTPNAKRMLPKSFQGGEPTQ